MGQSKKLSISKQLIEKIGNYLITRPYMEVAQLLSEFQIELNEDNKIKESDELN